GWRCCAVRSASRPVPARRCSRPSTTSGWSCCGTTVTICTRKGARPTRTPEVTQLVTSGWARTLAGDRGVLRATAPRIRTTAEEDELARDAAALSSRLPSLALRTARAALAHGPVLVQVPRRGYLAAIACGRCRPQARCTVCSGQLEIASARQIPHCRWCGAVAANWSCQRCGFTQVRAMVTG